MIPSNTSEYEETMHFNPCMLKAKLRDVTRTVQMPACFSFVMSEALMPWFCSSSISFKRVKPRVRIASLLAFATNTIDRTALFGEENNDKTKGTSEKKLLGAFHRDVWFGK